MNLTIKIRYFFMTQNLLLLKEKYQTYVTSNDVITLWSVRIYKTISKLRTTRQQIKRTTGKDRYEHTQEA